MSRRIRLGVITDEFFDVSLGRMGGFGWAARQLSRTFSEDPSLGVEVVYLSSELQAEGQGTPTQVHGTRIVLRRGGPFANFLATRRERLDLLITIDYNLGYSVYLRSQPRTPTIIWIRDPRGPAEVEKINTTRIPGHPDAVPQGLFSFGSRSIQTIARESRWFRRPFLFATQSHHLIAALPGAFGFQPEQVHFLPNDLRLNPPHVEKSSRPTVVFLGRLDPIKRPWIFAELARSFPQVEFLFLGQAHFHGPGSWAPTDVPSNVRSLGHVGEEEKLRVLTSAWAAVNSSTHEAVAVSMLEALACETPLLSCVDPGQQVSRFGIYVGRFDGDGMDSLPAFRHGLQTLLENPGLRRDFGRQGRAWIRSTHTRERFLESFWHLCELAGLR